MRVIWRDSNAPKEYKPIRYRGYMLWGTPRGWEITVPGDTNLYSCHYCAQNAVDAYLGDLGQHGTPKRKRLGIKIVGKKGDETA